MRANGTPLGAPVTFAHVVDGELRTPESLVQTVAWDQRFGRRFFFKTAYLHRNGSHAYIVNPDPARGVLTLGSDGESKYWELETTGRFLASEYRDLSVSYVRSHSTRDLNDYDQFFGNFRNPIIRANENSLSPTDVPNRLIVRGTLGLPGKWVFSPLYEWRTGFPWSAVNEFQDFVGERNGTGRLPTVSTLDFTLARPWHFRKYRFSGRHQDLQRLRQGQRARRPDQPDVSGLRDFLQSDSALHRVRVRDHEAVAPAASFRLKAEATQSRTGGPGEQENSA